MEKTILIGGKAGRGTAVTSHFVGKLFCSLGYYVFNYRDYPSLIRGGHNFNVLRISDKPVFSHKNKYDVILAFDQKTIDLHKKDLKKQGFVLGAESLKSKKLISISVKSILNKLNASPIIENDIMIGWLAKYFGIDKKTLLAEAKKVFKGKKKALIIEAIEIGYGLAEKKENFKRKGPGKYFISGSSAIGVGALASGLDVYIAYPMTPATPVLHFLAGKQLKHNTLVLQVENEIAVINAALASSFTGAKTMVGTSGGGLALMSETISLAGVAELPIVIYLAQRTGPATGVPTYTAQSDLKFAVNAGHGEFTKIIVAPGDAQESLTRTQEAFYLAAKHQVPVIIVGDKHVAESDYSSSELKISPISNKRFLVENPAKNYKRYKITKSGLSPRAVPGQGPKLRATSYEHDEHGYTVEDAGKTVKMVDKRIRKEKNIEKEVKTLKPTSVYGKGKNLLIGWGSTKGAILDSLSELKDYRFLQVSYISPFPRKAVEREIKKSKKVILVENSSTGLLADIIAEKTGIIIKEKILKYDGRPFSPEDIIKKIKK